MKNVELCHEWAHANQNAERRNGNLSYKGLRLYSYSALIANRVEVGVTLLTSESWSVTTSSHVGKAASAVWGCKIYVPVVDPVTQQDHRTNIEALFAVVEDARKEAAFARSRVGEILERAEDLAYQIKRYCFSHCQFSGSD